jgi:hypothetical protein
MAIDGIAGPIAMHVNGFTGGHNLTVGGQPVAKTGRRTYQLPTANGGTTEATVRLTFFDVYPSLNVAGITHRLGPPTPLALRVLMFLPVIFIAGGLVGGLVGALAILVNGIVLRAPMSTVFKVVSMLVVFLVGAVVLIAVATALQAATGSTASAPM